MYKLEDLVYLASFIDGEGSIMVAKSKHKDNRSGVNFYASISITNTNKEVINYLKDTFGFSCHPRSRAGTVNRQGIRSNKDCWILRMTYKKASNLLVLILPYLRIKQRQAALAISLQKLKEGSEKYNYNDDMIMDQFEIYKQCRILNSPGVSEQEIETLRPEIRVAKQTQAAKEKGCRINGCEKVHYGVGLCRFHWRQINEQGMSEEEILGRKCSVCSISLSNSRKDSVYCSHSCSMKAYRKRSDGSA